MDAVVTHHLDAFRSGTVRFNEILAERLGVPLLGLLDSGIERCRRPLLSLKFDELDAEASEVFARLVNSGRLDYELFLHSWSSLPLELLAAKRAAHVWCGNGEIEQQVAGLRPRVTAVWTPGLVLDQRALEQGEISVFSFGMAHKIQVGRFERLRGLLEATSKSYVVYVSAANHETSSMKDAQLVQREMTDMFPGRLFFLGNLSDVAVSNYLRSATFFASFFPSGVRANNTSVASAMEHGAVVITNIDEYSPPHLVHGETVIDIDCCDELPSDPLVRKKIGLGAMSAARGRSWDALVTKIQRRR